MKFKKLFSILTIALLSLSVMTACQDKDYKVYDYYQEYSFELPFELTYKHHTDTLYFDCNYTIEQMNQIIIDAGYQAEIFEYDNTKRIFISAIKNDIAHYFSIYDKNYVVNNVESKYFALSDHSAVYSLSVEDRSPWIYQFLFPMHIADLNYNSYNGKIKVFGTFDEIASYYRATGKDDIEIIEEENKIIFFCEGNENMSWVRGYVLMQYMQSETENYVNIQPIS